MDTFFLGWPGYLRKSGGTVPGGVDGPEQSQMQADFNIDSVYSVHQSGVVASGQRREDQAIWVEIQKNQTE